MSDADQPAVKLRKSKWSSDGPTCPHCDRKYTPDEGYYYDENGFEIDCDECGKQFSVQPHLSCTWTTYETNP